MSGTGLGTSAFTVLTHKERKRKERQNMSVKLVDGSESNERTDSQLKDAANGHFVTDGLTWLALSLVQRLPML